jgi:hypothetical protein
MEELSGELYALRVEVEKLRNDVGSMVSVMAQLHLMFCKQYPHTMLGSSVGQSIKIPPLVYHGFIWRLGPKPEDESVRRWTQLYFVIEEGTMNAYKTMAFYNRLKKKRSGSITPASPASAVGTPKRRESVTKKEDDKDEEKVKNYPMVLKGCTIVPSRIAAKGKYGFMIVPHPMQESSPDVQSRSWLLCCDDNNSRQGWISAVQSVIDY